MPTAATSRTVQTDVERYGAIGRAVTTIGGRVLTLLRYFGELTYLFCDSLKWLLIAPWTRRTSVRVEESVFQMERVSVRSFGIVTTVILFVGMILSLQMAYVLNKLGVVEYVADILVVAMSWEMAPLIVGIVMTGFMGAAIAAEIGTMTVTEEVLALRTMGMNPVRFLVAPRILGAMAMMPLVSVVALYVGVLGGMLISCGLLGIEFERYVLRSIDALRYRDVIAGLLKAEGFGILIALVSCHSGLNVSSGPEGVGKATTQAVVHSLVAIIVFDLLFTILFFFCF